MSDDVIRGGGGEVEESEGRRAESSGGRAAGWGALQASAGFPRLLLTQLLTLFSYNILDVEPFLELYQKLYDM